MDGYSGLGLERRNGGGERSAQTPISHPGPLPRVPFPVPRFTKMKGHPVMLMKTKEGGNFSRPTRGNVGGPTSEPCGSRRGADPNFWLLDSFLEGISREVYENKGRLKCQVERARRTRRELPLMIPDPGGRVPLTRNPFLDLISRIPCPVFRAPFHKNEGASGDVYENKGTRKFQVHRPGGTRQGIAIDDSKSGRAGSFDQESISRPYVPYPVSLVPFPVFRAPFHKNEGASGDVYENKGGGKFLAPNARKCRGANVRTPR